MLRWDRVGLFWINWCQVNITVIPFAGLLCITERASNTSPRDIFPLWFPVGLGSTTDSHSCELWKMKRKKMLFIGGRSMSRCQLWSLQELLQSVHWGVWHLMRLLGEHSLQSNSLGYSSAPSWRYLCYAAAPTQTPENCHCHSAAKRPLPAFPSSGSHNYECL